MNKKVIAFVVIGIISIIFISLYNFAVKLESDEETMFFKEGDMVQLKINPEKVGMITYVNKGWNPRYSIRFKNPIHIENIIVVKPYEIEGIK